MPTGGVDVAVGGFLADAVGAEAAAAIGSAALGGEIGAGIGGLEGLATGKNPITGALKGGVGGALTGGAVGFGPSIGGALGIGSTAGDVLAGAGGGAIGSALTGGNILTGAAEGGISGGIASQFGSQTPGTTSGAPSTTGAATGGGGPGISAGGTAAPAAVGADDYSFSDAVKGLQGGGTAAPSAGTNLGNANSWTQTVGDVNSISPSLASAANVASNTVAPPTSESGGFLNGILGKNASPLSVGVSGLGLATNAIESGKSIKGENQLKEQAAQQGAQGAQLESYLQSGALPPGIQASVTQASNAAKATVRSRYASMGMSGSSAEQQELAQIDQNAQTQGAQLAMQLLQTGIAETGQSSQLYESIMNSTLQNDKNLGSAISNFASAAGGGTPAGRIIQIPAGS